jgi:NAD(P)-dependent dehydrogenase (short-subunit alcohol dehydrogenase family)
LDKAEIAGKEIRKESGSDLVEVERLDLASLTSIRKCAETLLEKEDKIDILINNAGNRKIYSF